MSNDAQAPDATVEPNRPRRIQRKRTAGWRMPPNTIYVGRPTVWGNPFTHPDPAVAVSEYEWWITRKHNAFSIEPGGLQFAKNAHRDSLEWWYTAKLHDWMWNIRGKDLACWCPLDQPCHADVLLRIANGGAE